MIPIWKSFIHVKNLNAIYENVTNMQNKKEICKICLGPTLKGFDPYQKAKCVKYGICSKCYRKAYARWQQSKKRGNKVKFETYIFNPGYLRIKKARNKRYHYQKQFISRALATPKWVNVEEICVIYENCPRDKQVDHIIPINGENVCGLHVPWNLQYLSVTDNKNKSNKVVNL